MKSLALIVLAVLSWNMVWTYNNFAEKSAIYSLLFKKNIIKSEISREPGEGSK